ncbi:MAG: SDR family oxidoreductase [Nitrosopumilus sp.]|nr:SDR family oxidoreductase [Nitrosopumilus sp.]
MSKSEEIDNKLDEIVQNENVDIFIHSVTPEIINKKIEECTWEDFQNHIDIQTKSFYKITQKIIPKMKQMKKGKIITILSSYVVGRPPSMISPYIVAKYSQLGLVKTFAVELGKYGITTNAISPSMTETVLIDKLPKKLKEFEVMDNPSKRLGNTFRCCIISNFSLFR